MAGTRASKKMPSFNSVATGGTSSLNLPLGMKYDKLVLEASLAAVAFDSTAFADNVEELRLIVDGDTKIQVSGAQLLAINAFYKEPFNDGALVLNLSRPWLRTVQGEETTGYGTVGLQTMSLEVDWKTGLVGDLVGTVYAERSQNEPLGQHLTIRKFISNVAAISNDNEMDHIPRGKFFASAIHMISGDVDDVAVEANQRVIFEGSQAVTTARYGAKRSVQAGYYHIDFAHTNQGAHAIPMILNDFRIKYASTAAGAFPVLVERIEGLAA